MGYLEHFGLEHEPFSNAPDARFYFDSEQHVQALRRLRFAVDSNKGLGVVVGDIGTGKTTLARRMLDYLDPDRYQSSLLIMVHSGITPEWLLSHIAVQMGVSSPAADRLVMLRQLYERLLEIDAEGRRAVVLIDEAQMLQTRELMEEFRGLLNLEIPGRKLLNILFFGLPELEENLRLDPPLAQRVAVRCRLSPLTPRTTASYIWHRLQIAGGGRMVFEADAVAAVHQFSRGVPRLINTLCDNCLFEGASLKADQVDEQIVISMAQALDLQNESSALREEIDLDNGLAHIEAMLERLEMKY
ncbi:type II secretion system protein A [Geoalkalibacter ferrihydriticus]|uniref:ATPase AAA n=2 Tax=Geoalkalibacter ferrihydriticus TaxID=392333 RepID=A0A0C2HVI1_9BACT|nr:AAA family ATPase [Geoalkalibacter ferrihydriticus]KIH76757.1 ATPase AAA [Geoalkalibacter ferrihydriticus DSM 17813]SDL53082.1 type II secretion system protein A [Geoalkalibacter ferrihydriticus]